MRYRCPRCRSDAGLWQGIEATAWRSVDEYLKPTGEHGVDPVELASAYTNGDVGCTTCGWEGITDQLERLGVDGKPLPEIHRQQLQLEQAA